MTCPSCGHALRIKQGRCRACRADVSYLAPAVQMQRWRRIQLLMSLLVLVAAIAATVGASWTFVTYEPGHKKKAVIAKKQAPRVAASSASGRARNRPTVAARTAGPGGSRPQVSRTVDVPLPSQEIPSGGQGRSGLGAPVYSRPGAAVPPPAPPVPPAAPAAPQPVAVATARAPEANPPESRTMGDVVIGITAIDYYPLSCVVWGFAFNDNPHMVDFVAPNMLARDDRNMLCQRSLSQSGGSDWSIHSGNALYFWPAFTFPHASNTDSVTGYNRPSQQSYLSTVTLQFSGMPACTLQARERMTNRGHFDDLPSRTRDRILRSLRDQRSFHWWEEPNGRL